MKNFVVVVRVIIAAEDEGQAKDMVRDALTDDVCGGMIDGFSIDHADKLQGD